MDPLTIALFYVPKLMWIFLLYCDYLFNITQEAGMRLNKAKYLLLCEFWVYDSTLNWCKQMSYWLSCHPIRSQLRPVQTANCHLAKSHHGLWLKKSREFLPKTMAWEPRSNFSSQEMFSHTDTGHTYSEICIKADFIISILLF